MRRALPKAQVAVDLFHVVQLAVKIVGDVRRRATRELYGRRGRSGDPGYGIKNLLARNLEHLTAEQFAKIIEIPGASAAGQQAAAAWIAKEKLRDALNLRARVTGSTPCERNVRDRLFSFYLWCARLHQGNTAQDPGRDQEASTAIPGKAPPRLTSKTPQSCIRSRNAGLRQRTDCSPPQAGRSAA